MSRHPLRSRHGAGCLMQCTVLCTVQPTVWVTVHGHCSWTLFMNTVHRNLLKKKKEYKIFKIFLVYDLIYEIFLLKLL